MDSIELKADEAVISSRNFATLEKLQNEVISLKNKIENAISIKSSASENSPSIEEHEPLTTNKRKRETDTETINELNMKKKSVDEFFTYFTE